MDSRKTSNRKSRIKPKSRTIKRRRKTNKLTSKKQVAGGIFGTSFDSKITEHLIKLNVIDKDQSKIILSFAKKGNNKTDKINFFVDKTLEIVLENLHNIWKITPNEKKSNENYKKLTGILDNKNLNVYKRLQEIHNMYKGLKETDKKVLIDTLSTIKLNNNITGTNLLTILYNLYEKWVEPKTLQTLKDPKFADLYEKWFDIKRRNWLEPNVLEVLLLQQ